MTATTCTKYQGKWGPFECSEGPGDEPCGKDAPWVDEALYDTSTKSMMNEWMGQAWCDEHRPDRQEPATRWANVEVWVEYGPETAGSALDALFDAVADAAHAAEPPGLDVHVSGATNQPAPTWALDSGSHAEGQR